MFDFSSVENDLWCFIFQKNRDGVYVNGWVFGLLKVIVNSNKSFSCASLYRESVAKCFGVPSKRVFDSFVFRLIEDGLLVQGEWKKTNFGKEKPLVVSDSLRKFFGVVVSWNAVVVDVQGKEVWD